MILNKLNYLKAVNIKLNDLLNKFTIILSSLTQMKLNILQKNLIVLTIKKIIVKKPKK